MVERPEEPTGLEKVGRPEEPEPKKTGDVGRIKEPEPGGMGEPGGTNEPEQGGPEERGKTGKLVPVPGLLLSWFDYWKALALAITRFSCCFSFSNCLALS